MRNLAGWAATVGVAVVLVVLPGGCSKATRPTEVIPAEQGEQTIAGEVAVVRDGAGIKQITIHDGTEPVICVCTSTEAGEEVARLDGKSVVAAGTLVEKAGKRVLKVSRVAEVK